MSNDKGCQSTPPEELKRQIASWNEPKNEREWWACKEIERLTAEVAALKNQLAAAQGKLGVPKNLSLPSELVNEEVASRRTK